MRPLHRAPQDMVSGFHKEKDPREKWEGWGESQRDRQKERQRVGGGRAEGVGEREAEAQRWKPQHCSGSNLKSDSITSAESTGHTDQPRYRVRGRKRDPSRPLWR